jgi:rhodanese-related sulfurtransferase
MRRLYVAFDSGAVDDVPVKDVWAALQGNPKAVLIDVRTRSEWAFVGMPDLSGLGSKPILVEWQTFPDNRLNPAFVEQVAEQLAAVGADQGSELFFICRSGGRSLMAARAIAAQGYTHCHNVADGFEGPLDPHRQRGTVAGWKAEGLPWLQG